MNHILNITNGDCAIKIMQQAGIPGSYLAWQDILHSGPVPNNLALAELSRIRAKFIADCGWGTFDAVHADFIHRDKQLMLVNDYDKVILWFEHDLYDQLQIVQILDWLQQNPMPDTELSMICTDQYLGMQTPDELLALRQYEQPITTEQLQIASKTWSAFRSPTPEKWTALVNSDTSALPFLQEAMLRLLEEYPSTLNGLSRTAHKALEIIAQVASRPEEIFQLYQDTEERRFLGDSSFWLILQQFINSDPPLITLTPGSQLSLPSTSEQTLAISPSGRDVLSGQYNWLEISPINRWIGGVHLTPHNIWLWDVNSKQLSKKSH